MYQVVRVKKKKATAIGAMQSHNLRQYKTVAPNIDGEKSESNVVLIECDDFASAINTRVGVIQLQQKRKIRKDCPRALEYVISASSEFFESATEKEKSDYFNKSLEYLKSRHGNENVISAVIHNDESTPHMHVVIVPVIKEKKIPTKDNPTGIVEKLNPKHFCDKFELQRLHSEFNERVGSVFGLSRGEQSDRQHKTTVEYRRELAREVSQKEAELEKVKAELAEYQELQNDYNELAKDYRKLNTEYNLLKLSQNDESTPERVEVQQDVQQPLQSQPMSVLEHSEVKQYELIINGESYKMTAEQIKESIKGEEVFSRKQIEDALTDEQLAEVFKPSPAPNKSKGFRR